MEKEDEMVLAAFAAPLPQPHAQASTPPTGSVRITVQQASSSVSDPLSVPSQKKKKKPKDRGRAHASQPVNKKAVGRATYPYGVAIL